MAVRASPRSESAAWVLLSRRPCLSPHPRFASVVNAWVNARTPMTGSATARLKVCHRPSMPCYLGPGWDAAGRAMSCTVDQASGRDLDATAKIGPVPTTHSTTEEHKQARLTHCEDRRVQANRQSGYLQQFAPCAHSQRVQERPKTQDRPQTTRTKRDSHAAALWCICTSAPVVSRCPFCSIAVNRPFP